MNQPMGLTVGSLLLAATGCMRPEMPPCPPTKPAQAPQMKALERLVGTWSWSGEMVSPTKEEIMKHMPPGSPPPPTTMTGSGKSEFVLGGHALKSEGTMDMGDGQKMTYVEYWMWDGRAEKYRAISMSDWAELGTGAFVPCDDCDGFCMKGTAVDAQGAKKGYEGCMRFVDNNTHEFTFTERGPMGKMTFKGTAKRQK